MKKLLLASGLLLLLTTVPAHAQTNSGLQSSFGLMLTDTAKNAGYSISGESDLASQAAGVISIILTLLGTIFLAMIIYSGIRWMTAGGNEQSIDKAKGTIRQAIIGLIIVVGAYALSYFFLKVLN